MSIKWPEYKQMCQHVPHLEHEYLKGYNAAIEDCKKAFAEDESYMARKQAEGLGIKYEQQPALVPLDDNSYNDFIDSLERVGHHQVSEEIWRVKIFLAKFGHSSKLVECDTTKTKRLSINACKGCGTYKDNLGPCETFCQGLNERFSYCDHDLKCHPIAWHLIERLSTSRLPDVKELLEALKYVPSTHVPISKIGDKTYYYMCKEDIAQAIVNHLRGQS